MKKALLVAINSKYIHSNPAVYALRAYARDLPVQIEIAEFTINQMLEDILAAIYEKKPDLLAFSCYIWNIQYVEALLRDLNKILPGVPVILGGPEVTYDPERMLTNHPNVKAVILGEGEATFREVLEKYIKAFGQSNGISASCISKNLSADSLSEDLTEKEPLIFFESLKAIPGLCLNESSCLLTSEKDLSSTSFFYTSERPILTMDQLPFVYEEWNDDPDLGPFKNKILYYETSRGCPFRCSYCLSSVDKKLRKRSLDKVFRELKFFLDHKVQQVKFIDRTFNCDEAHALSIWTYLRDHDNGITNFHFEISADILTDNELDVLSTMRPGLVQLEIGVQSTNPETIKEIHRTMDLQKLRYAVDKIHSFHNIHEHLDLIAGLPYEGYESFIKSFNDLYSMKPDQLQLGFLKVLKGTFMASQIESYELKYTDLPPYEVLSTRWISYEEIRKLKKVEAMVELYYNSHQFVKTLAVVVPEFSSAFSFFSALADFYDENGYFLNQPARSYRYQVLLDFLEKNTKLPPMLLRELLTFDLYYRENLKSRLAFMKDLSPYKDIIRKWHPDRSQHIEFFEYPVYEETVSLVQSSSKFVAFDYSRINPLDHNVHYEVLSL